jgi:hypothetical protein
MAQRADLQVILEDLVGGDPPIAVYYQEPSSGQMSYPCILYKLDDLDTSHADNMAYRQEARYLVTVIDRNPDSAIRDKVAQLPKCRFNRFYVADGLNHFVFHLFF